MPSPALCGRCWTCWARLRLKRIAYPPGTARTSFGGMEAIELTANLHLFRFEVGQAYLWRDDAG